MPLIKLKLGLKQLQPEQILQVLASDRQALTDSLRFLELNNYVHTLHETDDGVLCLTVERMT